MIRGVFESVTAKVTDGVGALDECDAAPRRAPPIISSFFFTHRRLRTRLFMQVGDERRTNGKNFFHPSHRSSLPLSYETPVRRRRRRRKNYVHFVVARAKKCTCCDKKKSGIQSITTDLWPRFFSPALDKELFSDCQGAHSKSYFREYSSVSSWELD